MRSHSRHLCHNQTSKDMKQAPASHRGHQRTLAEVAIRSGLSIFCELEHTPEGYISSSTLGTASTGRSNIRRNSNKSKGLASMGSHQEQPVNHVPKEVGLLGLAELADGHVGQQLALQDLPRVLDAPLLRYPRHAATLADVIQCHLPPTHAQSPVGWMGIGSIGALLRHSLTIIKCTPRSGTLCHESSETSAISHWFKSQGAAVPLYTNAYEQFTYACKP